MAVGCVICTEEFTSSDRYPSVIKACGHSFHDECLKTWLKKSRTCPICRNSCLDSPAFIVRLHLQRLSLDNPTINNLLDETFELKKKVEEKDAKLREKDALIKLKNDQIKELQMALNDITVQVKNIEESLKNLKKIQVDKAALTNRQADTAVVGTPCRDIVPPARPNPIIRTIRIAGASVPMRSTTAVRGVVRLAQRGRVASASSLPTTSRRT